MRKSREGEIKKTISLPLDKVILKGTELVVSSKDNERDAGILILLGVYTGLRKTDLLNLKPSQFVVQDNQYCVVGVASKTGKEYNIPIKKYIYDLVVSNSTLPDTILSKQRSGMFLNRWIERQFPIEKARALRTKRTISCHSLRKTFGLHIFNKFGINSAREALQHSSIATTTLYLEIEAKNLREQLASAF